MRFKDCVAPFEFVPEWNDDRRLPRHVPWVTVTLGDDTEVNAALQPWGAISWNRDRRDHVDAPPRHLRTGVLEVPAARSPRYRLGSHGRRRHVPGDHPEDVVRSVQGAILRLHPATRICHRVLRQHLRSVAPNLRDRATRGDRGRDRRSTFARERRRRRRRRWRRSSAPTPDRNCRVVRTERRSRRHPGLDRWFRLHWSDRGLVQRRAESVHGGLRHAHHRIGSSRAPPQASSRYRHLPGRRGASERSPSATDGR